MDVTITTKMQHRHDRRLATQEPRSGKRRTEVDSIADGQVPDEPWWSRLHGPVGRGAAVFGMASGQSVQWLQCRTHEARGPGKVVEEVDEVDVREVGDGRIENWRRRKHPSMLANFTAWSHRSSPPELWL